MIVTVRMNFMVCSLRLNITRLVLTDLVSTIVCLYVLSGPLEVTRFCKVLAPADQLRTTIANLRTNITSFMKDLESLERWALVRWRSTTRNKSLPQEGRLMSRCSSSSSDPKGRRGSTGSQGRSWSTDVIAHGVAIPARIVFDAGARPCEDREDCQQDGDELHVDVLSKRGPGKNPTPSCST